MDRSNEKIALFKENLRYEALRIAATGTPSEVGGIVASSVASAIAAALPGAPEEVQAEAGEMALVVLATTEWIAAANAMAVMLLDGEDETGGESISEMAERILKPPP
jgi:hypothetical protein